MALNTAEAYTRNFNLNSFSERGIRSSSLEVLERLANALNIEVRELFNFSNRPFLKNKCPLELIELLNYLSDRKPKEIEVIRGIAKLVLEQSKH